MTSRGQFERLIRQGQILAFEPNFFVQAELVFWHLSGYLVERSLCLFPSSHRRFHAFFHPRDRGFLAPAIVQTWEVT